MRKRTIKCLFDNIMWYLIYLLPVILMLFHVFRTGELIYFSDVFISAEIDLFSGNIIFTALNSLFGLNGVLPLFADQGLIMYLTYFICCMIIHLAVDVLLFIVRWSHSMLDGFLGGKHD